MSNLIIAISGLTGAGKTTLGDRISQKMGIKHVSMSHKDFIDKKEVVEFTKNASAGFEKSFDGRVISEAEKQDCVVTTWLGPWLIKNADVRVWLYADVDSRIDRKARELKVSMEEARNYVLEKDKVNKDHFKKIYDIDIDDRSHFDMLLNTGRLSIDQCADMIIFLSFEKDKKKFK